MADAVEAGDARVIVDFGLGFEMMRAQLRAAMGDRTAEELAAAMRVDARRLRRFFAGDWPSKEIWEAGTRFTGEHAVTPVHVEAVAVNILTDQFPSKERVRMRKAFAVAAASVFREHGYRVPEGLAELAGVEPGTGKVSRYPEGRAPEDQGG